MKANIVNLLVRLSVRERLVLGGAAGVVVFSLFMIGGSGGKESEAIDVVRGPIAETVSVTGQLQPVQSVELSFQSSGRITYVPVKVGDIVRTGQLLANIDNSELAAQLRDAEAGVLAQQARLDDLLSGSRPEDIFAKEVDLRKAQQDLQNAYDNAYAVLSDGFTKADNAIRIQLEGMFNDVGTIDNPAFKLEFSCFCDQIDLTVNEQRGDTEAALIAWKDDLDAIAAGASNEDVLAYFADARGYLQTAKVMLENLNIVLNHPTVGLPTDTAATYRTSLSAARTSVVAAQTSVSSQEQSIRSYSLTVDRTSSELLKLRNGSTEQTILAQRAQLQSAQAQADRIRALISKGVIRSPVTGTVTRIDAKVGQSASPNEVLIWVASVGLLEMKANVPEVDVGKVSVGNRIDFTVDALPGEVFVASVSYVDPAETIIDGVVNYELTAAVPPDSGQLKSGLTVNMDIRTRYVADALILPQFAIIQNDDGTFVEKIENGSTSRVPVTLGLVSEDGMVEILSGLTDGDRVVNIGLKQ